jgi:tetratricopeptide (TPR) repeat protein
MTAKAQASWRAAIRLKQSGKIEAAERCCRRVLEADIEHTDAIWMLTGLLVDQGRFREAVPLLHLILDRAPDSFDANYRMGAALYAMGLAQDALHYYDRALTADPAHAEAHHDVGRILHALGHNEAAIDWFGKAIALKPDHALAHAGLGFVLRENGRIAQAIAHFELALDQAPGNAVLYRVLAETRRFTPGDPRLPGLLALEAEGPALPVAERIELSFACARIFADIGDYDRSFRHLIDGNALKRRDIAYDEAGSLGLLQRIETVFTAELMHARRHTGAPGTAPIFIFGMPRTGSTLIEQVLATHPAVVTIGEDGALGRAIDRELGDNGAARFPEGLSQLNGEALRRIGENYLELIAQKAPASARIVNKMPGNFAIAGLIGLVLPHARFIHTRRDPVDTCLSCFSQLFNQQYHYTFDLAELGRFYRGYERLMAHWRAVLPADMMIDVSYEEFVQDTEGQARRIIAHCGLEWDESCLDFWRSGRPVRTASVAQVRQPIYRGSIGRSTPYGARLAGLYEALGLEMPAFPSSL